MVSHRDLLPFLLLLASAAAHGQQTPWHVGVAMDNDFFTTFNPSTATDHEYTHGTHIWVGAGAFDLLTHVFPGITRCGNPDPCNHRVTVSHEIYTPRREAADPLDGQRPHAGWLYGGIETERTGAGARTAYRIALGVIGPPALAKQAQETIHRWFGFRTPQGWEDQLPAEPTIQLHFSRDASVLHAPAGPLSLTGGYGIGADLGNALTQAEASIQAQACVAEKSCWLALKRPHKFGAVVHGKLGARGVLRNLLLDGTVRDSRSVPRVPWIPIAAASLEVRIGPVVAEYALKWRGPEYRPEPTGFTHGTLSLQAGW